MDTIHDVIILGAGLSGLSAAHFLGRENKELDVLILEKEDRAGGAIRSFQDAGFRAEYGAHGFLDNNEASRRILSETGLDAELQRAPLGDFHRFICFDKKLTALPQSPKMLLATPLLSVAGKLRLIAELWKKPRGEDQTIADWASYRFGKGILPMVDVAVTGTFAGDYERLSIDSVMPGVRDLEKEVGSVIRGLKKKKAGAAAPDPGHLPAMLNFPQGMERLIARLAEGRDIRFGVTVNKIEKDSECIQVKTEAGTFKARSVVMALPVNNTLQLLSSFKAPPVSSVPVAKIINVAMGFDDTAKVPRGFGFLAPEREGRFVLGAMFSSHMFNDRAPDGKVLLEVLVGGRRHPERLELSDDELARRAYADISELLDLPKPPIFSRVLRPKWGIPQLEMDHPALLNWRREVENEQQGLFICGFGWDGIGMNDMMKSAQKTVTALLAGGGKDKEKPTVRPVYF